MYIILIENTHFICLLCVKNHKIELNSNISKVMNVKFAGLGGQGILTCTDILGRVVFDMGNDVNAFPGDQGSLRIYSCR